MKTVSEIVAQLADAGLTLHRRQLYRNLRTLHILPVGIRQRPQRYPDDTAHRILSARGFEGVQPVRLLTLKQLLAQKGKASQ
jgi:hypothetical protein